MAGADYGAQGKCDFMYWQLWQIMALAEMVVFNSKSLETTED